MLIDYPFSLINCNAIDGSVLWLLTSPGLVPLRPRKVQYQRSSWGTNPPQVESLSWIGFGTPDANAADNKSAMAWGVPCSPVLEVWEGRGSGGMRELEEFMSTSYLTLSNIPMNRKWSIYRWNAEWQQKVLQLRARFAEEGWQPAHHSSRCYNGGSERSSSFQEPIPSINAKSCRGTAQNWGTRIWVVRTGYATCVEQLSLTISLTSRLSTSLKPFPWTLFVATGSAFLSFLCNPPEASSSNKEKARSCLTQTSV